LPYVVAPERAARPPPATSRRPRDRDDDTEHRLAGDPFAEEEARTERNEDRLALDERDARGDAGVLEALEPGREVDGQCNAGDDGTREIAPRQSSEGCTVADTGEGATSAVVKRTR